MQSEDERERGWLKKFLVNPCPACSMPMAMDDIEIGECPWCRSEMAACLDVTRAGIDVKYVHSFLTGRPKYKCICSQTAKVVIECLRTSGEGH